MTEDGERAADLGRFASSERLKAFADAVVAIAMTLLILPLMDSVGDVAAHGGGADQWLAESGGQLFSFLLSFALIANSWLRHHRLFDGIERVTPRLMQLTVLWMLTIVWLPIPTAMVGSMPDSPLEKVLYIGTLALTSVVMFVTRTYVLRHPELHSIDALRLQHGRIADVVMLGLYAAALTVAILVPWISWWAMFLLLLVGPLQNLTARILRVPPIARA